jgi:uncharacterized protein (DUF2062 family)
MALTSGFIGAVAYWSVRPHAAQRRLADLAAGLNAGVVVGFVVFVPLALLLALARLANLLPG